MSQHRPQSAPAGSPTRGEPRSADAPPPKATLFCPRCGHRDHVTGDWEVHEPGSAADSDTATRTDRTSAPGGHLRCPACETTVTGGSPEDRAPAPGLTPAQLTVRTGLALSPVLWASGVRRWWSMTKPLGCSGTPGAEDG